MKQITVFLENKKGHLSSLVDAVSQTGSNMQALTIADTSTYGLVRILADNSEGVVLALKEAGFTATLTDVIAVCIGNEPGSLASALKVIESTEVNVEYMYCFEQGGQSSLVLKVHDAPCVQRALEDANFNVS